MRLTFFYLCDAVPPYAITAMTPLVTFGWSRVLEYCTHIQLLRNGTEDVLHVSMGVDDCGSTLVAVTLQSVLDLMNATLAASFSSPAAAGGRVGDARRRHEL